MAALPAQRCSYRFLLLCGGVRRGGFFHPSCQLSIDTKPKGLLPAIVSKAKYVHQIYERFLERRFPRFYLLYSTFGTGFRLLMSDGKEIYRIKQKLAKQGLAFYELPYRDMEKIRQFRRDLIKAAPIVLISLPPFTNYFVFALMYYFPRQLLIRHFWTPEQYMEFRKVYHGMRAKAYPEILNGLLQAVHQAPESKVQQQMQQLLTKIEHGSHPEISQLTAVSSVFGEPPLSIGHLRTPQMKALSRVMFLTPHFPSFILRRRLRSHIYEIHQLDLALLNLGVKALSDEELKNACYVRGLNSVDLSPEECQTWLIQWLQLSDRLKESEASLLLHSMVFLSTNYLRTTSR